LGATRLTAFISFGRAQAGRCGFTREGAGGWVGGRMGFCARPGPSVESPTHQEPATVRRHASWQVRPCKRNNLGGNAKTRRVRRAVDEASDPPGRARPSKARPIKNPQLSADALPSKSGPANATPQAVLRRRGEPVSRPTKRAISPAAPVRRKQEDARRYQSTRCAACRAASRLRRPTRV